MNAFDIKSGVLGTVTTALKENFKKIYVSGEYINEPSKFPHVTIVETDNSIYQRASTDITENAVKLRYEITVYSNKIGYKESEAREIMAKVDESMQTIGFYRIGCYPVPNYADSTIYRIVARYEGVAVQEDGENLSYRIYRK